jgi:peptidoglycan/xylan/chitin deacetylase (PgdA/CDA1 family)
VTPRLHERRARGRTMVGAWRHDASTLAGSELGGWPEAPWRTRLLRRMRLPAAVVAPLGFVSPRCRILAEDLVFWAGARGEATAQEWRRLTSSYSVLVYHRFAGELKPGQERIDISPRRFRRQLRALRLLGFRPLDPEQVLAFHLGEGAIPRRAFVLTADDATADCVEPLRQAAGWKPQLFVPTAELGGSAHWISGEPVATWEQVEELAAAGVAIGSHTRHHRRLSELPGPAREVELAGSLADLRERLPQALAVIAYPNGDHDDGVREAARAAGYELGFTTEKGRNGAGTDPYRLRRVSIHGADGGFGAIWKVVTGEGLPWLWLRLRR